MSCCDRRKIRANQIQLNDGVTRYQVGENRLFLLDRRGRRITGDLAAHYILYKE